MSFEGLAGFVGFSVKIIGFFRTLLSREPCDTPSRESVLCFDQSRAVVSSWLPSKVDGVFVTIGRKIP